MTTIKKNNIQSIKQTKIQSYLENNKNNLIYQTTYRTQSIQSIFRQDQKQIILFAYKKIPNQESPGQILVLQKPKKYIKTQQLLLRSFNNMNLDGTVQKLFLSKIDPFQHEEISKQISQILNIANKYSKKDLKQRRKQIFQQSRIHKIQSQCAPNQVIAKRKIRVIKMDNLRQGGSIKGVVELGGKSIQYENLMNQEEDYYALIRKKVRSDEIFPQVSIGQQYLNPIDFECQVEQQQRNDDDYDSNDEQNEQNDYPDEDQSSRSSEDIIREDDQMNEEYYQNDQDEQQLYRRYLRKQRRKQRQIDEQYEQRYEEYD